MVLKMSKMLQIPLSCKRHTNHSEDAKLKWHCHTLPLDNTNVLTVKNIYFKTIIFFFFFSWKTKCTSRIFRKSSCMTVIEASVPVQLSNISLSSAIKLLSNCLFCCLYFLFVCFIFPLSSLQH